MSEPRVYVDMELADQATVTLGEDAYHHLVVVLRDRTAGAWLAARGDAITLFNGRGGEYGANIETVGKRKLTARIWQFRDVERESPLSITLVQAVSKGERMDYGTSRIGATLSSSGPLNVVRSSQRPGMKSTRFVFR